MKSMDYYNPCKLPNGEHYVHRIDGKGAGYAEAFVRLGTPEFEVLFASFERSKEASGASHWTVLHRLTVDFSLAGSRNRWVRFN